MEADAETETRRSANKDAERERERRRESRQREKEGAGRESDTSNESQLLELVYEERAVIDVESYPRVSQHLVPLAQCVRATRVHGCITSARITTRGMS